MSNTETHKILENYADYIAAAMPDFKYFGSEKNIQDLARSLNQYGNNSILLSGPAGIGRRSLIAGFVQSLDTDIMPIDMMNTNVYRINVQELFNTQNIARVEERFEAVLEELKSIKARTGNKPVLVIDDGMCFAKEITERRASSLLNQIKSADLAADDFDLILSLDNDALDLMQKNHKSFLNHFTSQVVEEMNDEDVIAMLAHESERYAENKLTIPQETLEKVVKLCKRYAALGEFSMPKNASVFLDEVATDFRLAMHRKPEGVIDLENQSTDLQKRLDNASDAESANIQVEIEQINACIAQSYEDWNKAKDKIKDIKELITKTEEATAKQQEKLDKYKEEFIEKSTLAFEALKAKSDPRAEGQTLESFMQTDSQNKNANFDRDATVAKGKIEEGHNYVKLQNQELTKIIQSMAFPITMNADYVDAYAKNKLGMNDVPDLRKTIRTADQHINQIVMGQEQMITPMISAIKQRLSNKKEAKKPKGVFLILGPSGVGKTFIAEVLAEELCGGKINVINMEGFKEKHTVSRMIGAPPGYAGYDQKAELVKISEENSSGVILFDEIEKAHLDVKQALLTPLDKGSFTSANGRDTADFRDNIIVMTSNFGQQSIILPQADEPFEDWSAQLQDEIYKAVEHFSPEFLNRCSIVCADFLSPEVIEKVVKRRINAFAEEFVGDDGEFNIEIDEDSIKRIVADHYHKKNGARVVQTILEQNIGDHICNIVLDNDADDKKTCGTLKICYNDDKFTYDLQEGGITLNADNENQADTVKAQPTLAAKQAFTMSQ